MKNKKTFLIFQNNFFKRFKQIDIKMMFGQNNQDNKNTSNHTFPGNQTGGNLPGAGFPSTFSMPLEKQQAPMGLQTQKDQQTASQTFAAGQQLGNLANPKQEGGENQIQINSLTSSRPANQEVTDKPKVSAVQFGNFQNNQGSLALSSFSQKDQEALKSIEESQKSLHFFLRLAIARMEVEQIQRNCSRICSRLIDGIMSYELTQSSSGSIVLQQSIQQAAENFMWSEIMIDKIKLANTSSSTLRGRQYPQQLDSAKKISQYFVMNLISPICETLHLKPKTALQLIDSFFCEQPGEFIFINRLETRISELETKWARRRDTLLQQNNINSLQQFNQSHQSQIEYMFNQDLELIQLQENRLKHANELDAAIKKTTRQIKEFYMHERGYLLQSLRLIFARSGFKQQDFVGQDRGYMAKALTDIRIHLLRQTSVIQCLLSCLIRNLEFARQSFQQVFQGDPSREFLYTYLQREQIQMLEILFLIAKTQDLAAGQVDFKFSHLLAFFNYLGATDFKGLLTFQANVPQSQAIQQKLSQEQLVQQFKIKDLGTITFLEILRIDIFGEKKRSGHQTESVEKASLRKSLFNRGEIQEDLKSLKETLGRIKLDEKNAIPILALTQVLDEVEAYGKLHKGEYLGLREEFLTHLYSQQYMGELADLLSRAEAFSLQGAPGCEGDATCPFTNGDVLKVTKAFINLIFQPILVAHDKAEDLALATELTRLFLLTNPNILKDLWQQIDLQKMKLSRKGGQEVTDFSFSTLRIFEDNLNRPLDDVPVYTYLLKVLCGKSRFGNRPASCAYNMINLSFLNADRRDTQRVGQLLTVEDLEKDPLVYASNLLEELLAGYVILLGQMINGATEQHKFDILSNLVEVFCKIIKQSPNLYFELNDKLGVVMSRAGSPEQLDSINDQAEGYLIESQLSGADLGGSVQTILAPYLELEGAAEWPDSRPEIAKNPMLILLIRSLFFFCEVATPASTEHQMKHIFDAVSSVFSTDKCKNPALDLIQIHQRSEGVNLQSYIAAAHQDHERNRGSYKCTMSYLKFVCKVYKTQYPQMLLAPSQQINLNASILEEMLRIVYSPIVQKFCSYSYKSPSHFAKFAHRLLKLTFILLSKFDSGNLMAAQIQILQPNPRFDSLLNIICKQLKGVKLQIILETLRLEQVYSFGGLYHSGRQTYFQNAVLAQLTRVTDPSTGLAGASAGGGSVQRAKTQINDMIAQSIKCLNQISRMVYQQEQAEAFFQRPNSSQQQVKDQKSLKLYYIGQIPCVKELSQHLFDSSVYVDQPKNGQNIASLMAFYQKLEYLPVNSSSTQDSFEIPQILQIKQANNILALEFLKVSCQIWQTSSKKFDLSLLLTKTGVIQQADLRGYFLFPVIAALREITNFEKHKSQGRAKTQRVLMRYLIQSFEMLAICGQSQQNFLEQLFNKQDAVDLLVPEVRKFFSAKPSGGALSYFQDEGSEEMAFQLGSKMLAFFSIIVQQGVVKLFYENLFGMVRQQQNQPDLLRGILDSLIFPVCQRDIFGSSQFGMNLQPERVFKNNELSDYYSNEEFNPSNQNTQIIQKACESCQALLSVTEFLILLQNLYAIDPVNNESTRRIVAEVYNDDKFQNFFELTQVQTALQVDIKIVCGNINFLNQRFREPQGARNASGEGEMRDSELIRPSAADFEDLIDAGYSQALFDAIQGQLDTEQASCTQFNHDLASAPLPFRSRDRSRSEGTSSVSIRALDTYGPYTGMQHLHDSVLKSSYLMSLTTCSSLLDPYQTFGSIGSEFLISTKELKYLLINNGYHNINAVNEFKTQAQKFNLCMSTLVSLSELDKIKASFTMNIGRTKLNQLLKTQSGLNSISGSKSFLTMASRFALVDKDFPGFQKGSPNAQGIKQNINQLVTRDLKITQGIFTLLKQQSQESGSFNLVLSFYHSKALFEQLQSVLSSINLCVSSSSQKACAIREIKDAGNLREFLSADLLSSLADIYKMHMSNFQSSYLTAGSHRQDEKLSNVGYIQNPAIPLDRSNDSVFQQIVLSALQILESVGNDTQISTLQMKNDSRGIMTCLSGIVQVMQVLNDTLPSQGSEAGYSHRADVSARRRQLASQGFQFKNSIRTLQVAIELLDEESVHGFMSRKVNPPLKIMIQRLTNTTASQIDVEETILILQFLNSYAKQSKGAQHLYSENIFPHLLKNPISELVSDAQFQYYQSSGYKSAQRNPYHVAWCYVLVLIRTLNSHLLEGCSDASGILSGPGQADYSKSLIGFLLSRGIAGRMQALLCGTGQGGESTLMSQAMLEEVELTTSLVSQIFMQADSANEFQSGFVQGLKDCLIFGLPALITSQTFGDSSRDQYYSQSERHLKSLTANYQINRVKRLDQRSSSHDQQARGFSLLDLKSQVQSIKIHMNLCTALMNLLLEDKSACPNALSNQSTRLFPLDWQYLQEKVGNTDYHPEFNQTYPCALLGAPLKGRSESGGYGALITDAFASVLAAQEFMKQIYDEWNADIAETKILFQALQQNISCDLISNEYFGLNSIFVPEDSAGSFEDFVSLFECALQMGNQTAVLFLEKMKECYLSTTQLSYISPQGSQGTANGGQVGLTITGLSGAAGRTHRLLDSIWRNGELSLQASGSSASNQKKELINHAKSLQSFTNEILRSLQAGGRRSGRFTQF